MLNITYWICSKFLRAFKALQTFVPATFSASSSCTLLFHTSTSPSPLYTLNFLASVSGFHCYHHLESPPPCNFMSKSCLIFIVLLTCHIPYKFLFWSSQYYFSSPPQFFMCVFMPFIYQENFTKYLLYARNQNDHFLLFPPQLNNSVISPLLSGQILWDQESSNIALEVSTTVLSTSNCTTNVLILLMNKLISNGDPSPEVQLNKDTTQIFYPPCHEVLSYHYLQEYSLSLPPFKCLKMANNSISLPCICSLKLFPIFSSTERSQEL